MANLHWDKHTSIFPFHRYNNNKNSEEKSQIKTFALALTHMNCFSKVSTCLLVGVKYRNAEQDKVDGDRERKEEKKKHISDQILHGRLIPAGSRNLFTVSRKKQSQFINNLPARLI